MLVAVHSCSMEFETHGDLSVEEVDVTVPAETTIKELFNKLRKIQRYKFNSGNYANETMAFYNKENDEITVALIYFSWGILINSSDITVDRLEIIEEFPRVDESTTVMQYFDRHGFEERVMIQ